MTYPDQLPPSSTPANTSDSGPGVLLAAYVLYLASFFLGFTWIIGVIIAYVYKGDAPQWQQQHYRFLIRTFWIGMLYLTVGYLLVILMVGFLILGAGTIWLLVRCIRGLKSLSEKRPPNNLTTWLY